MATIICLCEGLDDLERFAQTKEAWLRKSLKLPKGLPSDGAFRRVFTVIESKASHACFMTFTKDLLGESFSKLFAIGGVAVCDGRSTASHVSRIERSSSLKAI